MSKIEIKRLYLCVDINSYLLNFKYYYNESFNAEMTEAKAIKVVRDLTNPIKSKNHILFVSNDFTSCKLARKL